MKEISDIIITDITYNNIKKKLICPYHLSYERLEHFNIVQTIITLNHNTKLTGDVIHLRGYTDETIQSTEEFINNIKGSVINKNINEYIEIINSKINPGNSFAVSSLLPPVEFFYFTNKTSTELNINRKDLIYSLDINDKSPLELKNTFSKIIHEGYQTVKIKLGKNFYKEIKQLQLLSDIDLRDLRLRFDANGGYNYNEAKRILKILSEKIYKNTEYLEQPFNKNAWKETKSLIKEGFFTHVMIDESIYDSDDILKAKNIGVKFIKIKLCKFGSLDKLKKVLNLANQLELNVVVGNGVATDISNYFELFFYLNNKDDIFGASESVGFMKFRHPVYYNIIIS